MLTMPDHGNQNRVVPMPRAVPTELQRHLLANPLRDTHEGSSIGFCYERDRTLFVNAALDDGPLLVAVDSNILIDVHKFGETLMDQGSIQELIAANHAAELDGLAQLLDLWLTRDIRFIPLPRSLTDANKNFTPERRDVRVASFNGLVRTLRRQSNHFGNGLLAPLDTAHVELAKTITAEMISGGADLELLKEACAIGADVFLTQDRPVLKAAGSFRSGTPNITSPLGLLDRLAGIGVKQNGQGWPPWSGGMATHLECAYQDSVLLPDLDHWGGFMSTFGPRPD